MAAEKNYTILRQNVYGLNFHMTPKSQENNSCTNVKGMKMAAQVLAFRSQDYFWVFF